MDVIFCEIINNYIKCIYKESSLKKNFKTLYNHKDYITNIILLDDNTLSSCSTDGTVNCFNTNNFENVGKIEQKEKIVYHLKLSDNSIILCFEDGSLKIYKKIEENTLNKITNIKDSSQVNYKFI